MVMVVMVMTVVMRMIVLDLLSRCKNTFHRVTELFDSILENRF